MIGSNAYIGARPARRPGIAALALMAASATVAVPALGQSCATDYHRALGTISAAESRPLRSIGTLLRSPAPEFSGRWLFVPASRSNRDSAANRATRVCAETAGSGRRTRCVRWETQAPAAALLASAPPTREEQAILKFAGDTVTQRGAIPEVGNNGRYYFVLNRVLAEFESYLGQPANPALCAGVPHYLDFLLEQMQPIRQRMDDVAAADARARELADARVAALARLARARAAQVAATAAIATSTTEPVAAPARVAVPVEPEPARPRPIDYTALSAEILRLAFGSDAKSGAAEEGAPIVRLQRARAAMATAAADSERATLREAALAAFRLVEAGVYVEHMRRRFGQMDRAVFATAAEVRAAHARICTCGE